jgi:signal transduction histidine kinase
VNSGLAAPRVGRLTKRELGEAYLLATGVVLAGVLGGLLFLRTQQVTPLFVVGALFVGGLVVVTYWLRRFSFGTAQVWRIATWGALGTASVTACIVGGQLTTQVLSVSHQLTIALIAITAAGTVSGTLVGMVIESHRTTQRVTVRNSVLQRVLRHNLRNDMSVVLSHVEEVKTNVDEPHQGKLGTAEKKIDALVNLVDNIRQVDTTIEPKNGRREPVDLVPLVEGRVAELRRTHSDADLDLDTELPEQAWAHAEEQFGLVIDNVVESAIMNHGGRPTLHITVTVDDDAVTIRIDDVGRTIPEPDLSVLTAGPEERLIHGQGVELWLVAWLTERSNGELSVDTDGDSRRLTITLPRVRPPLGGIGRLIPADGS